MMKKPKFVQSAGLLKEKALGKISLYFRVSTRYFHLQILPQLTQWKQTKEKPKIVMHKNRGIATLHSFLHILPAAAALVFVVFNLQGYLVGNISTSVITAIQFAAKVLEVLIQTSLTAILLSLIRYQAVFTHNLPLGSLLAPVNTVRVSYLWSLELWGSLTSPCLRGWRRVLLSVAIPATIILAAIVGPSSAILMIPRSIIHPNGRLLAFLDDTATLFPESVELTSGNLRYV